MFWARRMQGYVTYLQHLEMAEQALEQRVEGGAPGGFLRRQRRALPQLCGAQQQRRQHLRQPRPLQLRSRCL